MKEDREAAKVLQDPDPDAKAMAKEELDILELGIADKEQELQLLTLPRDPNDDKNVILEVRAGTGGDEAALFAADLMRMYIRYAEQRGWKTEMMSSTESSVGGYKEAVVLIKGEKVYSNEIRIWCSRVQRVPATETQGRVHTSACTIAILPEADEVDDVQIESKDLDISTFRLRELVVNTLTPLIQL